MNQDPALQRLAQMAGVQAAFTDVFGERREVPAATQQALLAALGLAAGTAEQAERTWRTLTGRTWTRPLPPAMTTTADAEVSVPLSFPAGTGRLDWQVQGEDELIRQGDAEWKALPLLEATEIDGIAYERRRLDLPALPAGYHRMTVRGPDGSQAMPLIVGPGACWLPSADDHGGSRLWGVSCQVYSLRSARNWGIGDFTDLATLAVAAARLGAALIGVNPLHALFPDDPGRYSPYSPSSRLFLNILYIDVEAVPEFATCAAARRQVADPAFQQRLAALRAAPLVDYAGVTAAKRQIFELLFREFSEAADAARRAAFDDFCREGGEALRNHARFEALSEHFSRLAGGSPWWGNWPLPYHDPRSAEVAEFSRSSGTRIAFFMYLQWLADEQLATVQARCRQAGMAIGLYRDLAVGADRGGAETWLDPDRFVRGVNVGAPPDEFNKLGQDWGLPPLNPLTLREHGFAGFVDLVRANMRHAGALRIDHVMALMRLYWVPARGGPAAGTYVGYPLPELLHVLALESTRHRCMVVGEDLGTVPEGLSERLQAANVLSYRVLWFEQTGDGRFRNPADYPPLALTTVSTHDLPTLAGWWQAHDVALRESCGLFPDATVAEHERERRSAARRHLMEALAEAGLIADPAADQAPPVVAVHRFLARTPCLAMVLQIEDAVGEVEQVNLPGTIDQHPNWRRKLGVALEELVTDGALDRLADGVREERSCQDRSGHAKLAAAPSSTHPS